MPSLQPVSVISDGIYYPSYPELAEKLPIINQVQTKFCDILTRSVKQDISIVRNVLLYQETLIKNIIRLCINQPK